MIKPINCILFATNLSQNCAEAFDFVVSLATRYQASILILHVIEKMPEYPESRLKGLLGEKKWAELLEAQENSARQALIGKKSSNRLIREALNQFCLDAGIDNTECGYISREILIRDGDVVQEIIEQSAQNTCDLIVMGAKEGVFSHDIAIGHTIKSVLRKSKIPVLVVPPEPREQA